MSQNAAQRPVLGQWAELGALYDARTDKFVPFSLLKSAPPAAAVRVIGHNTSEVQLSFSDSYAEKFSKMKVGAELSASFLSGLINVDGSGRYLRETRDSNLVEEA